MNGGIGTLRPGLLALELALIAAIFLAEEWIPLSKTPPLLLVAWGSMVLRGVRWRDAGLVLPPRWPRICCTGCSASGRTCRPSTAWSGAPVRS